jgi:protein Xni
MRGRPNKTFTSLFFMATFLAIDGLNILRRLYEAGAEPDSPEKAEAATRHTLSAFHKLVHVHQPTHVLAAFDYGGPTWRHALYPRYRERNCRHKR